MNVDTNLADANAAPTADADLGMGNPSTPGESDVPARSVDIINTVDDDPAKDQDKGTADNAAADSQATANEESNQDGGAGDADRFDKHPRFQELRSAINELKVRNQVLESIVGGKGGDGNQNHGSVDNGAPDFKDISHLSKEELLEWFEENPVEFLGNYTRQVLHESASKEQSRALNQQITQTFSDYEKSNSDFKAMWDSGEIEEFMEKHPGHNAMSAHMAITQEKRIREAVDKAVRETEARVIANFQAKKGAGTMGDAGGGGGRTADARHGELNNTKQSGGLVAAIAARLHTRRSGANG